MNSATGVGQLVKQSNCHPTLFAYAPIAFNASARSASSSFEELVTHVHVGDQKLDCWRHTMALGPGEVREVPPVDVPFVPGTRHRISKPLRSDRLAANPLA